MFRTVALSILILLAAAIPSMSQQRCAASESRDVNLSVERDKSKHPFKVIVKPVGDELGRPASHFKVDSHMRIGVWLTNQSTESILLPDIISEYRQYRLRLVKDGEEVAYRKGLCEQLVGLDKEFAGGSMGGGEFPSGYTARVSLLNLNRWYEPLTAGHYKLTVERRFWFTKSLPAVESNTMSFEVVR